MTPAAGMATFESSPSTLRHEDSVDDITDYVFAYRKKACQILFVAFLLPAVAVCVQSVHLYGAYGNPSQYKTLYMDSLQLDILIHSSLAMSFFVLLNCIMLVHYCGDGSSNSRALYYVILITCFLCIVFVKIVIGFVTYMLFISIASTTSVHIASSSSTCIGDMNNLVVCLMIVITIREKNRSYIAATMEQSQFLAWCMSSITQCYSFFFTENMFCRECVPQSYATMNDTLSTTTSNHENVSLLGYSETASVISTSAARRGSVASSAADNRRSSSTARESVSKRRYHSTDRVSRPSGGRMSSGRRSLSRTSELNYLVGTRVLAKWEELDVSGKRVAAWYPAVISYVYADCDDRMYDIVYYDGDVELKKLHEQVHEYDEELATNKYNVNMIGKSRRMKLLMLLWLSILYAYSCLKLLAFCFNVVAGEYYPTLSQYEVYIRRFHLVMLCLTIPLILAAMYLWFITAGHFMIMVTQSFDCWFDDGEMKHLELVVQTIECVLKIPLQPKRSKDKPIKTVHV